MTTLNTRMRALADLEGFDVSMLDEHDQPIANNPNGYAAYNYNNKAKGDMTVSEWRQVRFAATYGHQRVVVGVRTTRRTNASLEKDRTSWHL